MLMHGQVLFKLTTFIKVVGKLKQLFPVWQTLVANGHWNIVYTMKEVNPASFVC